MNETRQALKDVSLILSAAGWDRDDTETDDQTPSFTPETRALRDPALSLFFFWKWAAVAAAVFAFVWTLAILLPPSSGASDPSRLAEIEVRLAASEKAATEAEGASRSVRNELSQLEAQLAEAKSVSANSRAEILLAMKRLSDESDRTAKTLLAEIQKSDRRTMEVVTKEIVETTKRLEAALKATVEARDKRIESLLADEAAERAKQIQELRDILRSKTELGENSTNLPGVWRLTKAEGFVEHSLEPVAPSDVALRIEKDTPFRILMMIRKEEVKGEATASDGKAPRLLNFTFRDAPKELQAIGLGQKSAGIYLLNGDDLIICVGIGDVHPVSFPTKAGPKVSLLTFKRAK